MAPPTKSFLGPWRARGAPTCLGPTQALGSAAPASLLQHTQPVLWAWPWRLGFRRCLRWGAVPARPGSGASCPDARSPCAPRKLMDKQTFCSSQTTSSTSRYAAGLYRQGTWARARRPCFSEAGCGDGVGGQPLLPEMLDTHRGQAACANNRLSGDPAESAIFKDFWLATAHPDRGGAPGTQTHSITFKTGCGLLF